MSIGREAAAGLFTVATPPAAGYLTVEHRGGFHTAKKPGSVPKSEFIPVMSTTFGVQRSRVTTQGRTERPSIGFAQEASMTMEKTKDDGQLPGGGNARLILL